jgi:hypothetical protein
LGVHARRSPRAAAGGALAATTLVFFLVVGIGRVGLGVGESKTSRYVYITAVLLLPAVAVAVSHLRRRHVLVAALTALAVAWAGVHNVHALDLAVNGVTGVREHAQARIIAASQLVHGGVTTFPGQPDPMTAPDLTWTDLVYLVDNHDLPSTSLLPPSEFDTASVAANIEMALSPVPLLPLDAVLVQPVRSTVLSAGPQGCVQASATAAGGAPGVRLVFAGPASVSIRALAGSVITAHLHLSQSSRIESPPHQVTIDASDTVYLVVSLPGAAPVVDLPAGGAVLCGVAL